MREEEKRESMIGEKTKRVRRKCEENEGGKKITRTTEKRKRRK